jgi:hypothetical protein
MERDVESVGGDAAPRDARHQHFAREAGDAADQRQTADGPVALKRFIAPVPAERVRLRSAPARRFRRFRRSAFSALLLSSLDLRHMAAAKSIGSSISGGKPVVRHGFGDDPPGERKSSRSSSMSRNGESASLGTLRIPNKLA